MELDKANSNDKSIEGSASNEDVLVVLQTENGEQIALPMSALPSDFVPGDSGQIIMVESALDEQHQEIVVESSDINITTSSEPVISSENFVSLQQAETSLNSHIITTDITNTSTTTPTYDNAITTTITNNLPNNNEQQQATIAQIHNSNPDERPAPRTYSKSNLVKSYAPTCGPTRIYQQQSMPTSNSIQTSNQSKTSNEEVVIYETNHHQQTIVDTNNLEHATLLKLESTDQNDIIMSTNNTTNNETESQAPQVESNEQQIAVVRERKPKQKRKEPLVTRPLDEEDMKMEFQIIEEPSPSVQEIDVKKRPRKEYRTKKKVKLALALEKMSKDESLQSDSMDVVEIVEKEPEAKVGRRLSSRRDSAKEECRLDIKKEDSKTNEEMKKDTVKEVRKDTPRRELPKRASKEKEKDKQIESVTTTTTKIQAQQQQQQSPQHTPQAPSERRTRLSNICRVATGKMYKCNDCDFSTDRINNIVLHVKESCPNVTRKG